MPNDSSQTAKNARRHRRAQTRGVTVRLSAGEVNVFVTIGNVSLGGLFAPTPKSLLIGTTVALELSAPSLRAPLRLKGRVANIVTAQEGMRTGRLEGLGIEFIELAEFDRQRIQSLITQQGNAPEAEHDAGRPARPGRSGSSTREDFAGDVDAAKAEGKERRSTLGALSPLVSAPPSAKTRPVAITLAPPSVTTPPANGPTPTPIATAQQLPLIRKTRPSSAPVVPPVLAPKK